MNADEKTGYLKTCPVLFSGKHLFVNVDCPDGLLSAEALDSEGNPIPPFTRANCLPLSCDSTLVRIVWKGVEDLSALAGKPARFRFHLKKGKLYAFWVSPDTTGASQGFVAAGGPGFETSRDMAGRTAYVKAGVALPPGADMALLGCDPLGLVRPRISE